MPPTYPGSGTAIDRAGGELRLSVLAENLVGHTFHVEPFEDEREIGVRVVRYGREYEVLTRATIARSNAIVADQRDLAFDDADVLRRHIARLVDSRGNAEPETIERAMWGDR